MRKSLRALFFAGMCVAAAWLWACVDNDYDLSKISTDNTAVGGDLVMPFGTINFKLNEDAGIVFPQAHSSALIVSGNSATAVIEVPSEFGADYDLKTGVDKNVIGKFDDVHQIELKVEVGNVFDFDLRMYVTFENDSTGETVDLIEGEQVTRKANGKTILKIVVSKEDLLKISDAGTVKVRFATSDGQPHPGVSVSLEEVIRIVLSLRKQGGIQV